MSELAAAAASDAQHVAEGSASATARSRPQGAILSVSPHVSVGNPSPGVLHSQASGISCQWPYGTSLGPAEHADGEIQAHELDTQEDGDHRSGEGQTAKAPATFCQVMHAGRALISGVMLMGRHEQAGQASIGIWAKLNALCHCPCAASYSRGDRYNFQAAAEESAC